MRSMDINYAVVSAFERSKRGTRKEASSRTFGLLANSVHVADAADAVSVGKGPEGNAIVLVERLDTGTYETRIYQYQGNIVQEYAIQGRDYNPGNAQILASSATFDFSYEGNLLTVNTDQGSFNVALRSEQGGGVQ